MKEVDIAAVRADLEGFVEDVFKSLPRAEQRAKGSLYLLGLMLDGKRKSMHPMADRLGVDFLHLQK
ncbi:MAG: transposase, partial [Candidatus Saccharibacteria bacterium]|nr:transposase [Microbacteriaceae bacterium]